MAKASRSAKGAKPDDPEKTNPVRPRSAPGDRVSTDENLEKKEKRDLARDSQESARQAAITSKYRRPRKSIIAYSRILQLAIESILEQPPIHNVRITPSPVVSKIVSLLTQHYSTEEIERISAEDGESYIRLPDEDTWFIPIMPDIITWSSPISNQEASRSGYDSFQLRKLNRAKAEIHEDFERIKSIQSTADQVKQFWEMVGYYPDYAPLFDCITAVNFFDLDWRNLNTNFIFERMLEDPPRIHIEKIHPILTSLLSDYNESIMNELSCVFQIDLAKHTDHFIEFQEFSVLHQRFFIKPVLRHSSFSAIILKEFCYHLSQHHAMLRSLNSIDKIESKIEELFFIDKNIRTSIFGDVIDEPSTVLGTGKPAETRTEVLPAIDEAEAPEVLSAVAQLREDYARHVARRKATPSKKHLEWPGVRPAGMMPSEWIKQVYAEEIAAGEFRISDIRDDPNSKDGQSALYKSLRGEANRYNREVSELLPQTSAIYKARRKLFADLVNTKTDDPDLADFFAAARSPGKTGGKAPTR